jgi:hypothetical protein
MNRFTLALSLGAVGLILTATAVQAQGTAPDHLLCYKVKDPLNLPTPNSLDMQAVLQPEFTQKGCTLVKPLEFCVPAVKANVNPPPSNASIVGQPLQDDYICYSMKCPNAVRPTSKQITDQFGQRLDFMVKPETICVPATKVPLGCPVAGTNRAACGGPCPDPTQQCTWDKRKKLCECTTTPPPCAKPDKFGACGGDCTSTPGTFCQPSVSATGKPTCACLPPPLPVCGLDPATGTCGGTCPNAANKCTLDSSGQCSCQPVTQACASGANGCGGTCPLPGQLCHPDSTGACTCQTPCGQNPLTGTCGGDCPAGHQCVLTTTGCGCEPPANVPCSVDAQGACGGPCPNGASCIKDTSGACNCQPPPSPCVLTPGTNQCGGACPAGTTCQLLHPPAGPTCGCQPPTTSGPV